MNDSSLRGAPIVIIGTLAYVRIACTVHSKLSLFQQKPLLRPLILRVLQSKRESAGVFVILITPLIISCVSRISRCIF